MMVKDTGTEELGKPPNPGEQADFETAISLTGYGKFNYLLLLVAIPAAWSTIFDTSTMSYILPSAQCDLNLSNLDKGVLNAMVYAGMISSAFLWGFLSDTLGRRKLLLVGYYLLSAIVVASSLSQVFWILALFKFLGGFVACGPFAILLTYVAEFNGSHYRARVMMVIGIYNAMGIVAVPALALLIIPQTWSWTLFSGYFVFNSWRLFLLMSALPSFLAGCGMLFFEESPKFLMSCGRRDEALKCFREFTVSTQANLQKPISDSHKKSLLMMLKVGISQMKPFFYKPHVSKVALIFTIQFGALWGMNTIRLWLPQLFAIVEEYFIINESASGNASLCDMLASRIGPQITVNETLNFNNEACVPAKLGNMMYLFSIIVGAGTALFNLSASSVINFLGKKTILVTGYAVSCCCVVSMYWCNSMEVLLVLSSLFVGSSSMCTSALLSVVVDLFPTSLRTMAVSLTMMMGRVGALIGNITFPVFLEISCSVPFFLIGAIVLVCSALTFLLPKTTGKALE